MDADHAMWTPRPLTEFGQRRYLPYPHSNGFSDGGTGIVLGESQGDHVTLWKRSLRDDAEVQIARLAATPDAASPTATHLFFDVAEEANRLVAVAEQTVWIYDLDRPGERCSIYRAGDGETLNFLPSISADGSIVVVALRRADGSYSAIRIDVASGRIYSILQHDWWANHVHLSPHDPSWIGYCHEGDTLTVPDRMWAWHADVAPTGRPIFDQHWDDARRRLSVGHERNCFHAPTSLTIAYGVSVGGPRGLYEVPFDPATPPRLVSGGDRDWHCNVSRDGRLAIVDTTGPHDAPGRGWDDAGDVSDVLLVDMRSGQRRHLARSHQATHPWHPHPLFSPNASRIFYNESRGPAPTASAA